MVGESFGRLVRKTKSNPKFFEEMQWKAVSKEELDAEKCRPGVPPSVRKEGINWKTKACYDNHKKQYGWLVTRVA